MMKINMSYKEVKMYTVICDLCWADWLIDWEYSCFSDKCTAWDEVLEMDWHMKDENTHHCTDCFKYDNERNVVLKNKYKIIHNFWDMKWKDFVGIKFETKEKASGYLAAFESPENLPFYDIERIF